MKTDNMFTIHCLECRLDCHLYAMNAKFVMRSGKVDFNCVIVRQMRVMSCSSIPKPWQRVRASMPAPFTPEEYEAAEQKELEEELKWWNEHSNEQAQPSP
jgi:hypothetical protein